MGRITGQSYELSKNAEDPHPYPLPAYRARGERRDMRLPLGKILTVGSTGTGRTLESLFQQFQSLGAAQKRLVQFRLCENALRTWREYVSDRRKISYIESVAGTRQKVDAQL